MKLLRVIARATAAELAGRVMAHGIVPIRWRNKAILLLARNRTVIVGARLNAPLRFDAAPPSSIFIANCHMNLGRIERADPLGPLPPP